MFQNSTLPSVSVDIARNLPDFPRLRVWQGVARLEHLLPLPRTFREYLVWLLMMAGVTVLALLQVSTTLQISQAQAEVNALRGQYMFIEQENAQLLWEISHFTTLERVEAEAVAAGFVPALKRRYVTSAIASDGRRDAAAALAPRTSETPAPTTGPSIEPDYSSRWSVEMPAQSRQLSAAFASQWGEWSAGWTDFAQAMGRTVAEARAGLSRQWLKIDLTPYLWIGNPNE